MWIYTNVNICEYILNSIKCEHNVLYCFVFYYVLSIM